ncbi:MAG TPA: hypothetical protein VIH02_02615 [Flavobacterium sp.]
MFDIRYPLDDVRDLISDVHWTKNEKRCPMFVRKRWTKNVGRYSIDAFK